MGSGAPAATAMSLDKKLQTHLKLNLENICKVYFDTLFEKNMAEMLPNMYLLHLM